jgi:hypothetical protein
MNHMFTLDTKITDLNVKEKNIRKVFFSMNIHKVATPEMMLEEAKSYALFFRESKGKFSAYIALHLLSTNRRLYYSHSDNPFFDDRMEEMEEEAYAFAESLGAMLDEIDFTKLSDAEQDRWIDEQEIFSKKTSPLDALSESQPIAQAQQAAQTVQQPSTQAQPESQAPSILPVSHAEQPVPAQPIAQVQPPTPVTPKVSTPTQPEQPASPAPSTPLVEQEQPTQQVQKPSLAERVSARVSPIPKTTRIQKPVPPPQTPLSQPETYIAQAAETSSQQAQQGQPPPARQQKEILQQAIKAGIVKPPKQTQSKETQPVCGGLRRDREALARLLTSF